MGKKRIDVDLRTQQLACYEYDKVVFSTDISSGLEGLSMTESTATPAGDHNILVKMPSKHMQGGGHLSSTVEPLPGVPWDSFFTTEGHAFHGTYWHDNFGVPMSHGCVNMRPEDSKWLFRWTTPVWSPDDEMFWERRGYGTAVEVI